MVRSRGIPIEVAGGPAPGEMGAAASQILFLLANEGEEGDVSKGRQQLSLHTSAFSGIEF